MERAFLNAALRGALPELKELLAKGCVANAKNEVKSTHCLDLVTVKQYVSKM